MKTLHVVILIALFSVLTQAQPRGMAYATYALKGPVKSFRTEVATFVLRDGKYVEGPRVVRSEAFFNRDGNRTDYHMYSARGTLAGRIVMKFEGRKNVETIRYDGAGRITWRHETTFDETGVSKDRRTYYGETLYSTTTWKKNSANQIVEMKEISVDGVLLDQWNTKWEGSTLHSYENKSFYEDGTLKQENTYVAPNKKTETSYNRDGSVAWKNVRVGQEEAQYGPDGLPRKATVIDQGDRLLDEMNIATDGSKTRVTQLPDEIDQHGNWTKQTKWFADPKGSRPLSVTYRALTYHEN